MFLLHPRRAAIATAQVARTASGNIQFTTGPYFSTASGIAVPSTTVATAMRGNIGCMAAGIATNGAVVDRPGHARATMGRRWHSSTTQITAFS